MASESDCGIHVIIIRTTALNSHDAQPSFVGSNLAVPSIDSVQSGGAAPIHRAVQPSQQRRIEHKAPFTCSEPGAFLSQSPANRRTLLIENYVEEHVTR